MIGESDGGGQNVLFSMCCACSEVARCPMGGRRGACRKGNVYASVNFVSFSRLIAFSMSSFLVVTCSMDLLVEVETSIFPVEPSNCFSLFLCVDGRRVVLQDV